MTTLREHIDRLDLGSWAALTKRTAQAAVEAAEANGRQAPAQLAAVAAMSESELIDNYRNSARQQTRRPLTLRQRLTDANHQHRLARQAADKATQDAHDAKSDATAARAEAQAATAGAEEAREATRTAREELARKALQRTIQSRADQQLLEELRAQLAKAEADTTAAYANAAESVKVAEAAKEREVAALDKFAKQGSQLAGDQRRVQAALDEAQSTIESLRGELERARAESAAQIAAVTERAAAAEQRAEERSAERTADRQEAEREIGRLRAEIDRIRSDAQTEIATANQRAMDASNEAHARMAERSRDRSDAQQAMGALQSHLTRARQSASEEIIQAQEQAALAIAAAGQNMDATIEQARADARRQVSDAHQQVEKAHQLLADTRQQLEAAEQARRRAEAATDDLRADTEANFLAAGLGLVIPVPSAEIRLAAHRIEHALTVLHQVDFTVAVRMSEQLAGERPIDVGGVRDLIRAAQTQLTALTRELQGLPSKLRNHDDQAAEAGQYAHAAGAACRAMLLRIAASAEKLREHGHIGEALDAVIDMLYRPEVQQFVPEWRTDPSLPTQP
jgi:colicin import membrane protein